ncbi:KR domain protein [Leptospira ryugenii]|uniref:KR domain protein n=1 Tax=Leptospira ryugenii TaxID=1917863 RepID=A0A2P2E522_9LEPT|nr:SDR family NAD(P)-dependent oxidoreductase [Leptospira ryugenii]GBF51969.1 KR domain protein [Leptospira ryugenii]
MKDPWDNRVVLITGASSGIGEALLRQLAKSNSTIIAIARRAEQISLPEGAKAQLISLSVDLRDEASILTAIQEIKTKVKQIDVIFNNAGITAHGRFDEIQIKVYHETFATNFFGPILLIQGLLPELKRGKGMVVTTSTVSALYGIPGRAPYSASKAALHAAMEAMRIELREEEIGVALVCVPYTKTALRTSGLGPDGKILDEAQANRPLMSPEEVAEALVQIARKKNSRLVTIDKTGFFVKWMRNLSPSFLEKTLFRKLYHDFH